jgi:putative FmdB family regulatory protein
MPTYEYECSACGHGFEKFQLITDKPVRRCPKCRRLKVRRLIGTGAGVIFKGSGFYQTDYRSAAYQAAAKKDTDTPAPAQSDSGSKSGSGTKPAKKEKSASGSSAASS